MTTAKPHWTTTHGLFWATAVGVILVAANLWVTTVLLWNSKVSTERQLRAYVFVDSVLLNNSDEKPGALQVIVHYTNGGLTPASKTTGWARTATGPYPPSIEFSSGRFAELSGTLGPGSGMFISKPVPGSTDEIDAAKLAIYAFGEVRYQDIFHRWHTARFRTFSLRSKIPKGEKISMAELPGGNDSD